MKPVLLQIALLSAVTASFSFTITETKIFAPFRGKLKQNSDFLGKLFSCGYCMGHWVALVLVLYFHLRIFGIWLPFDYLFTMSVVAWLAGFQWF